MVFAEIAKKRFDLTLKSGLLCAVILVPATALADSTAGESEKPTQVAMTTVPDIDSSFEAGSTEVKPTNQNKVINLSQHIQRKYTSSANMECPNTRQPRSSRKLWITAIATSWSRS